MNISWRKWFWIAGIAGVAVVTGVMVWRRADMPAHAEVEPPEIPVTVAQAVQRDVPILLSALGTVQAWNTISIHSQINGTLQSVNFVQGQEVHKGDILAQIDPRPLRAALDQARQEGGRRSSTR